MRKLASVQTIEEIQPIPDAERVCRYRVLGWWVVDQIGKYSIGDTVIYCEPDSTIPADLQRELFYADTPEEEMPQLEGFVLKTKKIRKVYSQGMIIPIELVDGYPAMVGDDVSEILGIEKYEPAVPAVLAGNAKGSFPSFMIKTDELRIQGLSSEYEDFRQRRFTVTEKLEGSSLSLYLKDGVFGVCSRNLELKEDRANAYWKVVRALEIEEKMRSFDFNNLAIQGELIGPGVQGNIYNLKSLDFRVFTMYNIDEGKYFSFELMSDVCKSLGIKTVPHIYQDYILPPTLDSLLEVAEGQSQLAPVEREGLVFRNHDRSISFKAISNKYLVKKDAR